MWKRYSAIVILVGFSLLGACSANQESDATGLKGNLDGSVYTSPKGSFSIECDGYADPDSVHDRIVQNGAALVCTYRELSGAQCSLMMTHITEKPDREFLIEMVEKQRAAGRHAVLMQTPAGYESFQEQYLGKGRQGRFVGQWKAVWVQNLTIVDVVITIQKTERFEDALQNLELSRKHFWDHVVVRGRLPVLKGVPFKTDPRILVTIHAIAETSGQLGYDLDLQRTQKPIVRMATQGKYGKVVISMSVAVKKDTVFINVATSRVDQDAKFAEYVQTLLGEELKKRLAFEKVAVRFVQEYDDELLVSP